ncbi:prevent-host-death family protein [Streptomyces sp. MUSC 14]|nr:prevent-host-death family protein [Streptomyces sp. MUSC 14]
MGEDEVAVADAKKNLSELLTSVRLLRRAYFLTSRGKRQAALVPVELGELVQQAGGPDKAAAILASHVGSQIAHLKAQPGVREDS